MHIALINASTKVTNDQCSLIAGAVAQQLHAHAAPAWNRRVPNVLFYPDPKAVPAWAHGVTLVDDIPDQPAGVLGYHTEDTAGQWGIVAASPSLNSGAQVMTGDWSVASVVSHEVLELFGDPSCNFYAVTGSRAYCVELCDPVEAPTYDMMGVSVSNFVTPAWFDPGNTKGPFDHLGVLKAPFTIARGGYAVYSDTGGEHQLFGDDFPAWRREAKKSPAARTQRRLTEIRDLT